MENNAIKINYDINYYKGEGNWHSKFSLQINDKVTLTFGGLSTGCGIAQVYGVSMLSSLNDKELETLKHFLDNLENIKYDVGLIICTLGERYYSIEPYLRKLGFIELSEYMNWRHTCPQEKQKLYGLKTKYEGQENI